VMEVVLEAEVNGLEKYLSSRNWNVILWFKEPSFSKTAIKFQIFVRVDLWYQALRWPHKKNFY
jgi:hypothetical protein